MRQKSSIVFWVFAILTVAEGVDRSLFKTCDQSSFCRRLRKYEQNQSPYLLDLPHLEVNYQNIEVPLLNSDFPNVTLRLTLTAIVGNIFRVTINEVNGLHPRFVPQYALNGEPQVAKLEVLDKSAESLTVKSGDNKVILTAKPLKLEFFHRESLVSAVNENGLFAFEHYRTKPAESETDLQIKDDPGAWEENFKSHHDSKSRGPSAISTDFTFPGAQRVYGLPEHGDRLALRTTTKGGQDPYRLYNLDVFEYELDTTTALYGAIPVIYALGPKHTAGIFWHNAAETWVDITNSKDANVVSSLVNLVSGSKGEPHVDVRFMSESGVLDFFFLIGPTLKDAVKQYTSLTGVHALPQLFTLGYHQSRWNYNDQEDVQTVVARFDEHNLPLDNMWLDIEYTEGKKYFTWDQKKFPTPENMIQNLTSTGRKLVVIIDPHIKRESGYFLHEDALKYDLYVKNKDGTVYEGWCWPGASSYLDFYNPATRDYYKKLYGFDTFKGTTHDVWIWNDMNEPSVFNGPEATMPRDCLHYGGWEHREVHNEYALTHTMVTHEGLLLRSPHRRPFILTRGHFAGSQRYSAVWTGDNDAKWSHLAASIPMCLSEALGAMSFCGADVGGFFHNPEVELLQRWFQAAIWLPFFRQHAHIDTRRRESYLYTEEEINRIRMALRLRYAHLPLWYTLFWEQETGGEPVIRPLVYHYPADENVLDIDNELLVGHSVLARPIVEPGESSVEIYLPGDKKAKWYDLEDFKLYRAGSHRLPVNLDRHLVFYRGGTIVPRKDRPRRSSQAMRHDPFTLYVALDDLNSASGALYVDDYESFDYKDKKYLYLHFNFEKNVLSSKLIDKTDYATQEWIERIVILGPPPGITGAKLVSKSVGTVTLETFYDAEGWSLTIRKPGVTIREPFKVTLI